MKIIEELNEFQISQEKQFLISKELYDDMFWTLTKLEEEGKRANIIFDTYIEKTADKYSITKQNALKSINNTVRDHLDMLYFDGTVICFKNRLIQCECKAKYSSALSHCPNCKK